MKKRVFAIFSVLIATIVLVAMVPGCTPTDGEEATIKVEATLCGEVYEGAMTYSLSAAGEDPQNGILVPGSHTVAPGTWTCEVTVDPAGAFLIDITTSETQPVTDGGNITFTANFEKYQDASIEFVGWTINGELVETPNQQVPVPYYLYPAVNATIGVVWEQSVAGCEGVHVSLNESNWLAMWEVFFDPPWGPGEIQVDLEPWLHVANNWCAVEKVPDEQGAMTEKVSQYCTVVDVPVEIDWWIHYDGLPDWYLPPWVAKNASGLWYLEAPHMAVDVHETFNLEKEVTYTKTIDWLNFAEGQEECTLFELELYEQGVNTWYPYRTFVLWTSSLVQLNDDEDVNPANDYVTTDLEMMWIMVGNPFYIPA